VSRGDYTELSIQRETVQDGQGGELEGLVVRVWGEDADYDQARGTLLLAEIRMPGHGEGGIAFPPLDDLITHVRECLELVLQ
jgi:hypothetical protein